MFHPTINTPTTGGGNRENATLQVLLQASLPQIFHILDLTPNTLLLPFRDTYWLAWSNDYYIVVGGIVWEVFINQEQLSRSTVLNPLNQHNLLNEDGDDKLPELDDDDENDGDD
jgi:hypothetical protein